MVKRMYKKMYTHLFNAVTDALNAIDQRNYGQAEALLKKAQQETEEQYIRAVEPAAQAVPEVQPAAEVLVMPAAEVLVMPAAQAAPEVQPAQEERVQAG